MVPEPGNPQSLNRYSYVYGNSVKFSDPSGHFPWFVVAVVALAVIDYGWTGYDLYQANQVINNPNASSEAKKQAYDTIGLTLGTEIFEPDLGPIQLPLDDIVRHATGIGVLKNIDNASNTVKKAALGLDRHLDSFTRRIGGENYKKWWWFQGGSLITSQDLYDAARRASGDFFEFEFPTAMNNADEIHFNLKGISDIGEAIRKGAIGEGYTNRELYEVLHNKEWYDKTKFYDKTGNEIQLDFLGD